MSDALTWIAVVFQSAILVAALAFLLNRRPRSRKG